MLVSPNNLFSLLLANSFFKIIHFFSASSTESQVSCCLVRQFLLKSLKYLFNLSFIKSDFWEFKRNLNLDNTKSLFLHREKLSLYTCVPFRFQLSYSLLKVGLQISYVAQKGQEVSQG